MHLGTTTEILLYGNGDVDLTQVSDVPHWVQCCVFVMKYY